MLSRLKFIQIVLKSTILKEKHLYTKFGLSVFEREEILQMQSAFVQKKVHCSVNFKYNNIKCCSTFPQHVLSMSNLQHNKYMSPYAYNISSASLLLYLYPHKHKAHMRRHLYLYIPYIELSYLQICCWAAGISTPFTYMYIYVLSKENCIASTFIVLKKAATVLCVLFAKACEYIIQKADNKRLEKIFFSCVQE